MPRILVIDNYDSFTYNLVQYLGQCGASVVVKRNDQISLDEILELKPDGIMMSPGPCTPRQSGICLDLVRLALAENSPLDGTPVFGVCLGHQAIGEVSGGVVERAGRVVHGKTSPISHDGTGVFAGMPNPFLGVRYHSLVIREDSIPDGFVVTARSTDDNEVMGIRHLTRPLVGVQFHPESVLTEDGIRIVQNFVDSAS